jgi:hypothetical protein
MLSSLSVDVDFCQQLFLDFRFCDIYALGFQLKIWPLNRLPDDSRQTPRTANRTITESGRSLIGRLFIGKLQCQVGRLSEDSTAGYFGKLHFVQARRFFARYRHQSCFFTCFGLELAAASGRRRGGTA